MFTRSDIVTRQLRSNNCRDFELLEPIVYITNGAVEIEVPAGFVTDHASIPRFAWIWLPPYGRWSPAAVVHDYLCKRHAADDAHPAAHSRADCDKVFLEALRSLDVKLTDRIVMWLSVRMASYVFGWGGKRKVGSA